MKVDHKVRALEEHLRIKDKFCQGRYLSAKSDYMQTFYKLGLVRSINQSNADCSKVNIYFKCMHNQMTVDMVAEIEKDPTYSKWMKTKYGLDEKEAKFVLDFYKKLGKKVK
jgi:hypothetical protein